MTRTERATHDLDTLQNARLSVVSTIAKRAGIDAAVIRSCQRDRDVGGLAHLIIRATYGERMYRAARSALFTRYS